MKKLRKIVVVFLCIVFFAQEVTVAQAAVNWNNWAFQYENLKAITDAESEELLKDFYWGDFDHEGYVGFEDENGSMAKYDLSLEATDYILSDYMLVGSRLRYGTTSTSPYTLYFIDLANEQKNKETLPIVKELAAAVANKSRYEQVLYVYEWLANNVEYDYYVADNDITEYGHDIYDSLISKKGVCDSYAQAFQAVMEQLGVPCYINTGFNHAWNIVQMEDGKWYFLDATWGDQKSYVSYNYLLYGTDSEEDGRETCTNMTISGEGYLSDIQREKLTMKAYAAGNGATGSYRLSNGEFMYFVKGENVTELGYLDYYAKTNNITGSFVLEDGTFATYKDGVRISPVDTVLKSGDANSDGEVDVADGVVLKKHLAGISVNINLDACDVNADSKVDVSDAVTLMKYLAGYTVELK